MVTISTDNILGLNEFRDSVGAQWTFLSEPGRKVQKDLEIQESIPTRITTRGNAEEEPQNRIMTGDII
jgi:hypothetical protein